MSFAKGFVVQSEVVEALVLRETRTRFGQHQLGYIWALAEPSFMILTFYALFMVADREAPHGLDIFGFLATGIVPYLLFRNTCTQVSNAITANRAMLFYPHVKPIDLVIARVILEAATYLTVFIALVGIRALYVQTASIDDVLLILIGFVLATLLGAGLGLVFCTLSLFSNVVDRAKSPILRPFFWVSGIFFTAASLPATARDLLLYNPVLHCTEYVRDGWYKGYRSDYVDPTYALAIILGLLFVGLTLERVVRRRIELT